MRKGLLLVIAMFAIATLMGAMAYTSATVESGMSYNIVNANEALLAMSASDAHNASYYNTAGADKLVIDLDKGNGDKDFGIQNNSTYEWDDLFQLTNNSENTIDVTINTSEKSFAGIKTFVKHNNNAWTTVNAMYGSDSITGYELTLAPGASAEIDLRLVSMSGSNKHERQDSMNLVIDAVAVK